MKPKRRYNKAVKKVAEVAEFMSNKIRNELNFKPILTPVRLIKKGMFACSVCGGLNPVENQTCCKCHEPKFILTK